MMSFLTESRSDNEIIEPRVSFDNIPLSAIRRKTRSTLFYNFYSPFVDIKFLFKLVEKSFRTSLLPRKCFTVKTATRGIGAVSLASQGCRNQITP